MHLSAHNQATRRWWGNFAVPAERWARWSIGPLSLWARRTSDEWRLAHHSSGDRLSDTLTIDNPVDAEPDPDAATWAHYAFEEPADSLTLMPRLADRAFVVRPETPLWIPPGQRSVLYIGTVVWIVVSTQANVELTEFPVFSPSDSWFGASTIVGEVCYASRTTARTRPDMLGMIPHRAITPVQIKNHSVATLSIQQLRLPVTALGLYEADGGQLWTDGVCFVHAGDREGVEFELLPKSAYMPASSEFLAAPRAPMQSKTVMHAFTSLFT